MEANPRIQVEHTVTEEVTGVDLLHAQLRLAAGMELAALGLERPPAIGGCAVQLRINLETLAADGSARPAVGTIGAYEPPSGPGLRVDGYGYAGYRVSPSYDSLLAGRARRGLSRRVAPPTGRSANSAWRAWRATWTCCATFCCIRRYRPTGSTPASSKATWRHCWRLSRRAIRGSAPSARSPRTPRLRGSRRHSAACRCRRRAAGAGGPGSGRGRTGACRPAGRDPGSDEDGVRGQGTRRGSSGGSRRASGSLWTRARRCCSLNRRRMTTSRHRPNRRWTWRISAPISPRYSSARQRWATSVVRRRWPGGARPDSVPRGRTCSTCWTRAASANMAVSPWPPSVAGAPPRLLELSPADGLVAGTGTVGPPASACRPRVAWYWPTTTRCSPAPRGDEPQEDDRLLGLAEQWRLPLVLFAEGGGGRPGDTDFVGVAGLDCHTFVGMARLSGLVPLVGVVSGRCFAGNAALLGCCDVIIATRDATIGMAGPAMIEGGGLGRFAAEEVGPTGVQGPNGVIDVLVADEAEAVAVARRYLGYFQGPLADWSCADQRELRHLVPENRLRAYDIRQAIEVLADRGSVLELRRQFAPRPGHRAAAHRGPGVRPDRQQPWPSRRRHRCRGRRQGRALHAVCDAFDIPIVSLCDTPGFMVGPEAEKQATVRHVSRMFVSAASLTVPFSPWSCASGLECPGHGGGQLPFAAVHRRLAQRRVRRHGPGRRGAAGFAKAGGRGRPQRREALFRGMVDKAYNGKALRTWPATWRSTR